MFRKEFKVKSSHTTSVKNRQTLIQQLSEEYTLEIVETVFKLFPNLKKSIIEGKKIALYFHEKDPILFSDGATKTVYPTCKFANDCSVCYICSARIGFTYYYYNGWC